MTELLGRPIEEEILDNLNSLDSWNSVSDLPKKQNEYYLIYLNKPNPQTKMSIAVGWYDDMYGFLRADGFKVTHWQHLPKEK